MATEKRLIDANALKEYLNSIEASGGHKYYRKGMDDVLHFHMPNIINDAPTVDAVEVPPVKIGDTAYFIIRKTIYEAKICFINWCQYRYTTETEIRGEVQRYCTVSAKFSDWGVNVFSTKEEAEIALAKMDGGKDNG